MKTVLAHPLRLKPCLAPTRLLHIAILWDVASTFLVPATARQRISFQSHIDPAA